MDTIEQSAALIGIVAGGVCCVTCIGFTICMLSKILGCYDQEKIKIMKEEDQKRRMQELLRL